MSNSAESLKDQSLEILMEINLHFNVGASEMALKLHTFHVADLRRGKNSAFDLDGQCQFKPTG